MNKQNEQFALGGEFYLIHERNGKVLMDTRDNPDHNIFVNEGLVYALNSAFGVSVGGAPSPYSNFYIGLSTANRTWQATDVAVDVHTVAAEFELYDESARPGWAPQALANVSAIELNDAGAEATYTISDLSGIGGTANVYGGFLISAAAKDGSQDATATLVAGANFASVRQLYQGDVFKVGYVLKAENKV